MTLLNISGLTTVFLMLIATLLGYRFPLKTPRWFATVVLLVAFVFAFFGCFTTPLWPMFLFEGLMVSFVYLIISYVKFEIDNIRKGS